MLYVCISSSADKIAHFQAGDIRRALEMGFFPLSDDVNNSETISKLTERNGRHSREKKCVFRFSDQLETSLGVCR